MDRLHVKGAADVGFVEVRNTTDRLLQMTSTAGEKWCAVFSDEGEGVRTSI